MNNQQASAVQQQREIVEQLQRESSIKRMKVSAAIEDLKKYIEDNQHDDCLVSGFSSSKKNPFIPNNPCVLL